MKTHFSLVATGEKLQLISSQFSFTEGPAVDKNGNIYFTDQPNNKIWKYSNNGDLSVFLHNAGRSNGMYFHRKGNLVTCADENNELWSIAPDTNKRVVLKDVGGKHFNGPNDLWIDKSGGIYFTDPYYQRPYWTRTTEELKGQYLYYLSKNNKLSVVDSSLQKPNGIVGTKNNKYLYVADIKADKTYRYTIGKKGKLSGKVLFAPKGSDGMTIDDAGNLYLTGKGIFVYNKAGVLLEHIDVPEPWTANVVFGGKNRDMLFITASKSIYKVRMKVKG